MCKCYVRFLNEHARFMTRYGAHSLSCPVYRESRDPVDQINDKIQRVFGENS
jgi:hypothetical protein